jgi:hypothetical protein
VPVDLSVSRCPVGGRRAPKNAPKLWMRDYLTGVLPAVPTSVDDTTGVVFGLDSNDQWGDCVVAGWDNLRRCVTTLLPPNQEVQASPADVLAWYQTQNSNFDPNGTSSTNGPGSSADGGMDMQTFLEYLVGQQLIVGFAAFDPTNDAELQAATYLFEVAYLGIDLQVAQQGQTNTGIWDYVPGSGDWGGHCVAGVTYGQGYVGVITWDKLVQTTAAFRANCFKEGYVVLLTPQLDDPSFRAGFNMQTYSQAWQEITGRPFPVTIPPAPVPVPSPPTPSPTPPQPTPQPNPHHHHHHWVGDQIEAWLEEVADNDPVLVALAERVEAVLASDRTVDPVSAATRAVEFARAQAMAFHRQAQRRQ